jgi:hypothetical protein
MLLLKNKCGENKMKLRRNRQDEEPEKKAYSGVFRLPSKETVLISLVHPRKISKSNQQQADARLFVPLGEEYDAGQITEPEEFISGLTALIEIRDKLTGLGYRGDFEHNEFRSEYSYSIPFRGRNQLKGIKRNLESLDKVGELN